MASKTFQLFQIVFIVYIMSHHKCLGANYSSNEVTEDTETAIQVKVGDELKPLGDNNNPDDFSTQPANLTLTVGESASFYLHSNQALSTGCTWSTPSYDGNQCPIYITPSGTEVKNLPDHCSGMDVIRPDGVWTYQYYGPDTSKDCGLTLRNTSRYDNGFWSTQYEEIIITNFYLYVKAPPESIVFKNTVDPVDVPQEDWESGSVTFNLTNPGFTENVTASCETIGSRPKANVTWWLGDELLEVNDTLMFQDETYRDDDKAYDVIDYLYYIPEPSHDGKQLRCVYSHESWNDDYSDAQKEASVNITVYSVPDPETVEYIFTGDGAVIGEAATLEIKFHSRPEPLQVFSWFLYDLSIPVDQINSTVGRYSAENITEIDAPLYLARLHISELESTDEGKEIILRVENEVGSTNFTIRLDNLENGGLETAAIAGIVVAVVVLIAICGIVAFFLVKKKQKSKSTLPVANTTRGVSTIPNVGRTNPMPVTDSENSEAANFETVDLQNTPTNTRHVYPNIEIEMHEEQPRPHNDESAIQVENPSEIEKDSTTKL